MKSFVAATVGLAALAAAAFAAPPAQAVAFGTLTFTQPTGTVGPSDVIDIFLTFTVDPSSEAFETSGGSIVSGGPSEQELIDAGFDLNAGINTNLNLFYVCSGTFTDVCDGPPYEQNFADEYYTTDFVLAPGDSRTFLFGNFTPTTTPVPAGTYSFTRAGLFIQAHGFDANGDELQVDFDIASTCPQGGDCGFSRTVVGGAVVPEPTTWALMITGFGATGALLRRRRSSLA
jgi:hypothetical protein